MQVEMELEQDETEEDVAVVVRDSNDEALLLGHRRGICLASWMVSHMKLRAGEGEGEMLGFIEIDGRWGFRDQ